MRRTTHLAATWVAFLFLSTLLFGCAMTEPKNTPDTAAHRTQLGEPPTEVKQPPPKPDHFALARNLIQEKHYEVALIQLQEAKKQGEMTAELLNMMGVCYRETNRNTEAEELLNKALKLDPEYAPTYNGLGMIYQDQNRREEALSAFRKAIALNPARTDFFNNLGYALLKQGQYEEALIVFRKGLTLDPAYQTARNNLALCFLHLHRDNEALQTLLGGNDAWVAYHNMAVLHRMTGRPDKAVVMERRSQNLRKDSRPQRSPAQTTQQTTATENAAR